MGAVELEPLRVGGVEMAEVGQWKPVSEHPAEEIDDEWCVVRHQGDSKIAYWVGGAEPQWDCPNEGFLTGVEHYLVLPSLFRDG